MAIVMAYCLYKSRTGFRRWKIKTSAQYLVKPFTFLDLFFNFQMAKRRSCYISTATALVSSPFTVFTNALLTM
ncbi:hypothetical protein EIP86_006959 [Pleurotus ostreatoroseus]|nr:hypothetical protein EIP86_006959 [Pleurotus ostreatoroseus]